MAEKDNPLLHCSFCGKKQDEINKLISGPEVYICNECVDLCYSIIQDETEGTDPNTNKNEGIPSPREIHSYLDQYVIGQEYAKQILSVAVYNHYIRLNDSSNDGVELDKANIMISGPTGSGKTYLAKTIARYLDVPFAIADATTLTESGYVGDDVESIIAKLLQNADYSVEKAQKGIIYIDEIDKKSMKGDSTSISRDVSGEGVQQALLKIIEGTTCRVPPQGGRKNPNQDMIEVDTTNILFIVGGAFVGLEKVIQEESQEKGSIGFNANIRNPIIDNKTGEYLDKLEPHHLVKYGIIPELVGRLPIFAHLRELDRNQLVQVLTEPKNSLVKQFKKMFGIQDVELEFTEDSLLAVADIAYERKTGARGLRSVIEKALVPIQYSLPDFVNEGVYKITITKEFIEGTSQPIFEYYENTGT